ncbi:MAG: T9SS type A sorting domain-containing protein, partial [Ekhidna sp.]|nr:T9SS type A sorting domain-containing protein [Ekhidna sp.]
WDIERSNGGSSRTVGLSWGSHSEVTDPATLLLTHFNSGASEWENVAATAAGDANSGTITSDAPWSTFSPFTLGSSDEVANPLPVELVYFNGLSQEGDILLEWQTATETNNDFFEIERSYDGKSFEAVGRVKGNGNSSQAITYQFTDRNAEFGVVYYRLTQYDFDGQFEVFSIIAVNNELKIGGLSLVVYPNPGRLGEINYNILTSDQNAEVEITVIDLGGQVYMKNILTGKLSYSGIIESQYSMSAGIYFLSIKQGDKLTRQKFYVTE